MLNINVAYSPTKSTIAAVLNKLTARTARFFNGDNRKMPFYWYVFEDFAENDGPRDTFNGFDNAKTFKKFKDEIMEIAEEIKDFVRDPFTGYKSFADLIQKKDYYLPHSKIPRKDELGWQSTISDTCVQFVGLSIQAYMREKIDFYEKKLEKAALEEQKKEQVVESTQKMKKTRSKSKNLQTIG